MPKYTRVRGLPSCTLALSFTSTGAEFENKVPENRYDSTLPLLIYFNRAFLPSIEGSRSSRSKLIRIVKTKKLTEIVVTVVHTTVFIYLLK